MSQKWKSRANHGTLDGVEATCSLCGHTVECAGTGEASERRCLMPRREECPRGEKNFYVNAE